ncbi:hypothetical protein HPB52_003552 [Rhipicephalus sanguineus]|uniref:Uncharacterized protein n=1 Tax=Rhipicephalus sanguineus TaxID=34632 RepID=A0A9D4T7F0_RHISA|nr:hypothetical protein HPB52_003552 [Rhipicephalus sanguineus]
MKTNHYVLYEMMFKETFPDPLRAHPKITGYVEEVVGYVEDKISIASQHLQAAATDTHPNLLTEAWEAVICKPDIIDQRQVLDRAVGRSEFPE